ncbi:type II toxin-antitoxin system VapC family toxin [Chloroflexota bacterium]
MTNYSRVYWDSSVWIALIKGETVDGVDRCRVPRMILEDAAEGKVTIFISRLVQVEVHKRHGASPLTRSQDDQLQADFFSHEYIKKIDVDASIAERARQIAWLHGLKPADAIHVASALKVHAEVLHHWDDHFRSVPTDTLLCAEPVSWSKQPGLL